MTTPGLLQIDSLRSSYSPPAVSQKAPVRRWHRHAHWLYLWDHLRRWRRLRYSDEVMAMPAKLSIIGGLIIASAPVIVKALFTAFGLDGSTVDVGSFE